MGLRRCGLQTQASTSLNFLGHNFSRPLPEHSFTSLDKSSQVTTSFCRLHNSTLITTSESKRKKEKRHPLPIYSTNHNSEATTYPSLRASLQTTRITTRQRASPSRKRQKVEIIAQSYCYIDVNQTSPH